MIFPLKSPCLPVFSEISAVVPVHFAVGFPMEPGLGGECESWREIWGRGESHQIIPRIQSWKWSQHSSRTASNPDQSECCIFQTLCILPNPHNELFRWTSVLFNVWGRTFLFVGNMYVLGPSKAVLNLICHTLEKNRISYLRIHPSQAGVSSQPTLPVCFWSFKNTEGECHSLGGILKNTHVSFVVCWIKACRRWSGRASICWSMSVHLVRSLTSCWYLILVTVLLWKLKTIRKLTKMSLICSQFHILIL